MKRYWRSADGKGGTFGVPGRLWRERSSGKTYILFARCGYFGENICYNIVADLDGPVLFGLLALNKVDGGGSCAISGVGLSEGRYLFKVTNSTFDKQGYISGRLSESFPDIARMEALPAGALASALELSRRWIIKADTEITATDLVTNTVMQVFSAGDANYVQPAGVRGAGEDIFWRIGDRNYSGVMCWSPTGGVRNLLRWPGDYTRAAGNFGTDGLDMVWTYGDGKSDEGTNALRNLSVMTAPYSTDPAYLSKHSRRLRSDVSSIEPQGFVVGCGYAARESSGSMFVVKLSDGTAWHVVPSESSVSTWKFGPAMGITCSADGANPELVALTASLVDPMEAANINRFRLDAWGPGAPAD